MPKRNVVHIEIPAADIAGAGKFYASLFGWKVEHDEKLNYSTWEPSEAPGGGFNPVSEDAPVGHVLIYIASEDIEADLKKIGELGGKTVTPKSEIAGVGWFALFQDPTGNVLGLYTGRSSDA